MDKLFIMIILAISIALGPLIFIWSLNILFPVLAIPYDFWTWLAAALLGSGLKARSSKD